MTNTPESDTMKTLKEICKENNAAISGFFSGYLQEKGRILFDNEAQLLATFNAWMAQQEPKQADHIECEEFYNICQAYRHARDNGDVGNAYEDLKQYIANLFKG